ncbi:hypothetical protein niasHT_020810 [Heterodera trifolii]|uniref:Uncharacterized protein n=1 Tax=Heterodera trifolii TaxID=157864 RepID=A0ABD2KF12_9BILA
MKSKIEIDKFWPTSPIDYPPNSAYPTTNIIDRSIPTLLPQYPPAYPQYPDPDDNPTNPQQQQKCPDGWKKKTEIANGWALLVGTERSSAFTGKTCCQIGPDNKAKKQDDTKQNPKYGTNGNGRLVPDYIPYKKTEVGNSYPTYPGQPYPSYPGLKYPTYPGQQYPKYPGQQYPTSPGQQLSTVSNHLSWTHRIQPIQGNTVSTISWTTVSRATVSKLPGTTGSIFIQGKQYPAYPGQQYPTNQGQQ